MKQGDIGTQLIFNVKDQDGTAVNLTGATVALRIKSRGETKDVACTVTDAATGATMYTTTAEDFTAAGIYKLEVKASFANGNVYRSNELTVDVEPKL